MRGELLQAFLVILLDSILFKSVPLLIIVVVIGQFIFERRLS